MINKIKNLKDKKYTGIIASTIVLMIIFTIMQPRFISLANLENILNNTAILAIVAMGMTMAILSGQIDLSVGSVMSFSAVVSGLIITSGENASLLLAIAAGLAIGALFGLFNGIMIGCLKYDYWLITFASMAMAKSIALVITNGRIIAGFPENYRSLGGGTVIGISSGIVYAIVICAVMIVITLKTRFGYFLYAIGDSESCALQSGIKVVKVRIQMFITIGVLAAMGGILLASKTNSCSGTLASGYEFDAIAAVVVGGTPFTGGKGGLMGTVFGCLLIAVMKSGLQVIGLTSYWQTFLIGLFIMVVIILDTMNTQRVKIAAQRRVYK